jgi:hypothetical protein
MTLDLAEIETHSDDLKKKKGASFPLSRVKTSDRSEQVDLFFQDSSYDPAAINPTGTSIAPCWLINHTVDPD